MDKEIEMEIIKAFVNKNMQERFLFELFSTKKRKNSIGRLCHQYDKIFNKDYMIEIPKDNLNLTGIGSMLENHEINNNCYLISYDEQIDGLYLPLMQALERVVGLGMPSIISCITGKLAYFEGEQEIGVPPRFILKR